MKENKGTAGLAQCCRALADETRLRILAMLKDGEICVCHIHAALRLPQPTVSRHLAYLRRTGLVEARRDGTWMHYRLARSMPECAVPMIQAALTAMSRDDGPVRVRA